MSMEGSQTSFYNRAAVWLCSLFRAGLWRDGFRTEGFTQKWARGPRCTALLARQGHSELGECACPVMAAIRTSTVFVDMSLTVRGNTAGDTAHGESLYRRRPLPCALERLLIPDGPPPPIGAGLCCLFCHFHLEAKAVFFFFLNVPKPEGKFHLVRRFTESHSPVLNFQLDPACLLHNYRVVPHCEPRTTFLTLTLLVPTLIFTWDTGTPAQSGDPQIHCGLSQRNGGEVSKPMLRSTSFLGMSTGALGLI